MTKRSSIIKLLALLAAVAAVLLIVHHFGWLTHEHVRAVATRLRQHRSSAVYAIGFVLLFGAATSIGLPLTPFNLAGGAIFGLWFGSLLNWLGTLLGAAGGYWLGRLLGKDFIHRLIRKHASLAKLEETRFVPMLRLQVMPVLPLNVLNFSAGVAEMSFPQYLAAVGIGLGPSTVIYTYFADSLLQEAAGAKSHALLNILIASALLMALSFLPGVVKRLTGGSHQTAETPSPE